MATLSDIVAAAPSFRRAISNHNTRGEFTVSGPGSQLVVPYWVDYAERTAALVAVNGVDEQINIMGATVTRRVPLKHHEFSWLEATRISFEDMGWDLVAESESHCLMTVTFEAPPYADTGDLPYVEFRGGPAPRQLAAPAGVLRTAAGILPAYDPGAIANGWQFELVAHNLPSIFNALAHLQSFQNRANDALFLGTFAAGCVICDGPSWQATRTAGNVETWTLGVGFRVTEPRYPWNFEVLENDTIGELFYGGTGVNTDRRSPLVNFNNVFAF